MKGSLRDRLTKLFGLLGSDNAGERENARTIIDEILRRNRKTWNDLTELLQTGASDATWNINDVDTAVSGKPAGISISALDLTHGLLEEYVELKPHEYVAVSLWILHTHVYHQFLITPRLALVSPVRGCGKTTVARIPSASGRSRSQGRLNQCRGYNPAGRSRALYIAV
jgi:hypothetical protein